MFADTDEDRPLSRFVDEAYVEVTNNSVNALQKILPFAECASSGISRIVDGLNARVQLRDGLLRMIKRTLLEAPDFEKTLKLNELISEIGVKDLLDSY